MDILGILKGFWESSGLAVLTWREGVMILISFVLLYLAIAKKFEPLLLLPIAFGILLANLPGAGLMDDPTGIIDPLSTTIREGAHWYDIGILRLIYAGVKSSIFPCLIFMGVGAMTDFGPLLANPMSLLLRSASMLHSPSLSCSASLRRRLPLSASSAARTARPPYSLHQSLQLTCSLP